MFSKTQIMIHERMVTAYMGHEEGCGEWRNHAPYLFFQPVLGTHAHWASKTQMTFHFSLPIQHLVAQSSLFCSHGSHSCHSHPLPWWALSPSLWHRKTRLCSFLCLAWDFVVVSQKPGKFTSKHTLKEVQDWTLLCRAFVNDTKTWESVSLS